jgi:hypothetical protein
MCGLFIVMAGLLVAADTPKKGDAPKGTTPASGPLRVSKANPRYFTDGSGRTVYLTGSHTWGNLSEYPPRLKYPPFDYGAYLDFLERHHHNSGSGQGMFSAAGLRSTSGRGRGRPRTASLAWTSPA